MRASEQYASGQYAPGQYASGQYAAGQHASESRHSGAREVPADGGSATTALSAARARVLTLCRRSPEPVTVNELALACGQHPSTVREHLQGLTEAGLIMRTKRRGPGRGRPTWLYHATDLAAQEHDAVAGMIGALAGALERVPDGVDAAVEAGRDWGRRLRAADETGRVSDTISGAMDALGFAPRHPAPGVWVFTHCPLRTTAAEHPDAICGAHKGLLLGLLEGTGHELSVRLRPFSGSGTCHLDITSLTVSIQE